MMLGLAKRRAEKLWLGVDFSKHLREGDTIAEILSVAVMRAEGRPPNLSWSDATEEFPIHPQTGRLIAGGGTLVQLFVEDTSNDEHQRRGAYELLVEVRTTQNEELEGAAPLAVEG